MRRPGHLRVRYRGEIGLDPQLHKLAAGISYFRTLVPSYFRTSLPKSSIAAGESGSPAAILVSEAPAGAGVRLRPPRSSDLRRGHHAQHALHGHGVAAGVVMLEVIAVAMPVTFL